MLRTALLVVAGFAAAAAPLYAQSDPLTGIDSLVTSGHFTDARARLQRWRGEHAAGVADATPGQRSHALLLEGRLATDADSAEAAFLALVLSYPSARETPEALLRLGQGLLDQGEVRRATTYLERLVRDYPRAPQHATGLLWLARARAAGGTYADACTAAQEALRDGSAPDVVAALLRLERDDVCARARHPAPEAAAPSTGPVTAELPQHSPATASRGNFSVQAAAVRDPAGARNLAARLDRAGFDARVVALRGSRLLRVRVGRFSSATGAAAVARRLRDGGFDALVVDDVRNETKRNPRS